MGSEEKEKGDENVEQKREEQRISAEEFRETVDLL